MIHERIDLVGVVRQIISLLHLAHEELTMNKEDVEQTFRLVNVSKGLPCLLGSFATLDVCQLVVC